MLLSFDLNDNLAVQFDNSSLREHGGSSYRNSRLAFFMSDDHESAAWVTSEVESSIVVERPMLIGRDQELNRVDAILERHQPALVVMRAEIGMGRTSLLREIEGQAKDREQRWRTARSNSQGALSVVPDTTEENFRQRVLELLQIHTKETFDNRMGQSRSHPIHSLIEQLHLWAPALLLVDGYRPGLGFASWFTDSFINGIKQDKQPVVIVVADQPHSDVDGLLPSADEVVTLGPLDQGAVTRYFELVGQRITPPMETRELQVYVEAARNDPGILYALTHMLELAK